MRESFDLSKEYGIVLEGGGAKGAYQIGVWKAFLECGVKIKGVSGVSVGALNGALICMGDYEQAEDIWKNISYSRIMQVDDIQMDHLMSGNLKSLSLETMKKEGKRFLVGGGFDITPLKNLIENIVDEEKIKSSDIEFIMGTFSLSNMKEIEITAKEAEDGYLKDYLMASSYFPLFKSEKLHGKKYLDGGVLNNVPINMLINRGYKNIIVVRIYGLGLEKRVKIPDDVNVIEISPNINLCSILEFNKKKSVRNITLGYYDALRVLKSLSGIEYYIDSNENEKKYLDNILQIEEELAMKLLTLFKRANVNKEFSTRMLIEDVLPQIAGAFKLDKNWNYKDMYFAILEYSAKKLRVQKYKLYKEEDFLLVVRNKLEECYNNEKKFNVWMELALAISQNIA